MAEYQKLQKIRIGKAEKWLIDRTKEAGLDIEGFEHEITDGFIEHILKRQQRSD